MYCFFSAFRIMKPDKLPLAVIKNYCEDHVGTYCIYFKACFARELNPISLDNSRSSCAFRISLIAG